MRTQTSNDGATPDDVTDGIVGATATAVDGDDAVGRPLLEVQDIYAGYDPHHDILRGVTLHVRDSEIVCVIGPNGAGKSTVFKGISIVSQLRSLFSQMTVRENLELGMYLSNDKAEVDERIQYVYDLFPRLGERSKQEAGTMSGGEQRMLEIGRALMWEPRLVLMDEPSAGLAPIVTKAIFAAIRRLNREVGLTVLMIEQNARQGLQVSDRGYVIELGRQTYEGAATDLVTDPNVRRAFLGGH